MTSFMDLAGQRQSGRRYAQRPVEEEKIMRCLEAARLAPSACNSQPWRFVVVREEETRKELALLTQQLGFNAFTSDVPVLIVACEEKSPRLHKNVLKRYAPDEFAQGDIAIAVTYLTLQAAECGLTTCMLGAFDEPAVRKLLDVPEDLRIRLMVAVGYPASDEIRTKSRLPLEEIVSFR